MAYDHKQVESEAQEKWAALALYKTELGDATKDPYYLLFEFPYPSGDLHIGHWYAFAVTDIYARMLRARGKNVLFPIGFDAFGLPAENAAMKNGADPSAWTFANIERMTAQIKTMGTSVDWSKEVITCKPEYYQWTQWLFTKLFEHGLAERREASVKWCPKDQTVLANEQVADGVCDRCGTPVEEKVLTQWFLKITQYAERLLSGLENLPWREDIKDAQRAWIGKSEGAHFEFALAGREEKIKVFTTRPDTVFGATYIVLAPEHPLVRTCLPEVEGSPTLLTNAREVGEYVTATKKKTERERSENKDKTGVLLKGITAINPANQEEIPIYIADYVLASYGTGAVMAVPAHDQRDFAFAQKMDLPMQQVVMPRVIDAKNPHVDGKETVTRMGSISILHDPKTNRYLCLRWKHEPWTTFITGGTEDGEDVVSASIREIHEETGYKNVKLVSPLGVTQSEFFASHKDSNRIGHTTTLLFELRNDERDAVNTEETTRHEVAWLTREEIEAADMRHAEFDLIWSRVQNGMDAYTGAGILMNSGQFNGRNSEEAKWDIVAHCGGEKTTNYRIRDWLVSRQRYWGCPIPVVYDPEGKPHIIPSEHLPWLLPTDVDFKPTGKAPLASSQELRDRVTKIFGEGWTPEYDTLDTFVDSSWYFLRYLAPHDGQAFSSAEQMKKWMPVHRYSGGSEHTTMHLLYARFFTKALHDLALVSIDEPFIERFNRGLILGPDGQKMSKSKGNVINPDKFVVQYGADAVRLYLAFIGPYNEPGNYPWHLDGVTSMRKFLDRAYRLSSRGVDLEVPAHVQQALAKAAAKVLEDGDRFKFNTAIAALMILVNDLEKEKEVPVLALRSLVILLAPFAPHLAEHLWERLGGESSVHQQSWPTEYELVPVTEVVLGVQVNGKHRGTITVAIDAKEADVIQLAREVATIVRAMGGQEPKRVIYVAGKILNIVV